MVNRKRQTADYYNSKVNRSLDFIEQHVNRDLSIHEIASFAGISTYHFHRIFQAVTGESLYACIIRLRIEGAAARLLTSGISITEAAYSSGFNDAATFSRAFKKHLGLSPSRWRQKKRQGQEIGEMSKIDHAVTAQASYNFSNKMNGKRAITPLRVDLKEESARSIVYVRKQGAFAADAEFFQDLYKDLYANLSRPSEPLLSAGSGDTHGNALTEKRIYVIYHNPLGITCEQQLRVSMGCEIDGGAAADPDIDIIRLGEGLSIRACYELGNLEYGAAWSDVYRNILPKRRLEPRDGYAYESYDPDCHDWKRGVTTVEICIPVRKL